MTKAAAGVVRLFGRRGADDGEPEVAVGLPPMTAAPAVKAAEVAPRAAVDLAGPPAWFLIGAGKTGKTMFARAAAEAAGAAGRETMLAALDPGPRLLTVFFEGAHQPRSADPAETAQFLRDAVEDLMAEPRAAILDMGGGNPALARVAEEVRDLAGLMEGNGVGPVAAYFLGARPGDEAVLETARVFAPRAAVVVLNHGAVDATLDAGAVFAAVRRRAAVRAAEAGGAVVVEMPRLAPEVADLIERRGLSFEAATGKGSPLGLYQQAQVRLWRERMEAAFAPVGGWMP